jgi:hypothetical protein
MEQTERDILHQLAIPDPYRDGAQKAEAGSARRAKSAKTARLRRKRPAQSAGKRKPRP